MSKRKLDNKQSTVDLRAEYLAADLIDHEGSELDSIFMYPISSFKRSSRHDVEEVENVKDDIHDYYVIEVNREGLYDALPQALFHKKPKGKGPSYAAQEMIEDIRRGKDEEAGARRFFKLFEKELNRLRIMIELQERQSLLGFNDTSRYDLFMHIWDNVSGQGQSVLNQVFYYLKFASNFSGSIDFLKFCLHKLFDIKVTSSVEQGTIENGTNNLLGQNYLGYNLILSNKDYLRNNILNLELKNIPREDLRKYMKGGVHFAVLSYMCDYFVPLEYELKIKLNVIAGQQQMVLSQDESFASRLSYTSTL